MKLKKHPLQTLLEKKSNESEIEASVDFFNPKMYNEKWRGFFQISNITKFLLPFISIITGGLWLGNTMEALFFGLLAVAWIVGGLGVLLLEFTKNYLLRVSITDLYNSNKSGQYIIILALCLAGLSIYVSLQGAKTAHQKMDKRLVTMEETQKSERNSALSNYDTQITQKKAERDEYKKSVSWQGKIDMSNKKVANIIEGYEKEIKSLEDDKRNGLALLDGTHKKDMNNESESQGFNSRIILIIVGVIELLILIFNWFPIHYRAMVKRQYESLSPTPASEQTFSLEDIQHLAQSGYFYNQHLQPTLNPSMVQQMNQHLAQTQESSDATVGQGYIPRATSVAGFKVGLNKENQGMGKGNQEISRVEPNIQGLYEALKNGIVDTRLLCKTYRVNVPQVNKARQDLGIEPRKKAKKYA